MMQRLTMYNYNMAVANGNSTAPSN